MSSRTPQPESAAKNVEAASTGVARSASEADYARGAKILSIGIASTGLLTFVFVAAAAHALGGKNSNDYSEVANLWAILFVAMSVMYRPVEQLLSRTISTAAAKGEQHPSLRRPLLLQLGFASALIGFAFLARGPLENKIGDGPMFWILVTAALAYSASYFARGFVAGHQWFALYGGLVLFESLARVLFPIGVIIGITTGQTAVALGIVAAPLASLLVVPWTILAVRRRQIAEQKANAGSAATAPIAPTTAATGGAFAISVALIQLGEQTLVNAGTLMASGVGVAGFIFSAMMVIRAPLQLFQAVQTSLLPHLSKAAATSDSAAFGQAIRRTIVVVGGFAGLVALGLLAIGPWAMQIAFDIPSETYNRFGLAIVALGMGAHLIAGTLNQGILARGKAQLAAAAWLLSGAAFVVWFKLALISDQLMRAEVGYFAAAMLLCTLLLAAERQSAASAAKASS